MHCTNCGKEINLSDKFCASCGTNLNFENQQVIHGGANHISEINAGISGNLVNLPELPEDLAQLQVHAEVTVSQKISYYSVFSSDVSHLARVSTSGGQVHSGTGEASSKTSAKVEVLKNFWLRPIENGNDRHIQLPSNTRFTVADGQIVACVDRFYKDKNEIIAVANMSAGTMLAYNNVWDNVAMDTYPGSWFLGTIFGLLNLISIGCIVAACSGVRQHDPQAWLGLVASIIGVCVFTVLSGIFGKKYTSCKKAAINRCENIITWCKDNLNISQIINNK